MTNEERIRKLELKVTAVFSGGIVLFLATLEKRSQSQSQSA